METYINNVVWMPVNDHLSSLESWCVRTIEKVTRP